MPADLKYYREERAKYPAHYAYRVNADEALQICFEMFWALGLPPLTINFRCPRGNGRFSWSWFKHETAKRNRISLSQITSIGVILHEIAHYMDYLNRVREMLEVDPSGCNGFHADNSLSDDKKAMCRRIRKEHYHGNRHRIEMAKLVSLFDKIRTMPVDMAKAA